MSNAQRWFILSLMAASILLFVVAAVWACRRIIRNKRMPEKVNKAGMSTALAFSGALILVIGLLLYAVRYCFVADPKTNAPLNWWEEIVNCFFAAIRTFKMGEEYEKRLAEILSAATVLFPEGHWAMIPVRDVLVAYMTVLNLLTPFVGGAVIVEVLAGAFPRFKLLWSCLLFKRTKYYFNELNAATVAMAKSIRMTKKLEKPVLIFANTNAQKAKDNELLLEAKQYGGICISDDLRHIMKPRWGRREYYLMDDNEFRNLQTLTELTEIRHIKSLKNAYIYLFVQSDAYVQIEKRIYSRLEKEESQKLLKGKNPTIIPVNGCRNLVQNLLMDVPLYEPLVHKADPSKLQVTILGNGAIGTEAFLSVYWFGQMMVSDALTMTPCDLTVNVVAKDTPDAFWSKIDYINPEIRNTVRVVTDMAVEEPGDRLCYNNKGEKNQPYCTVRYVQADVQMGNLWSKSKEGRLLDSDYIIVALGTDADNIAVAEQLCRAVGKKHFKTVANEQEYQNTVIAYAVYDSEMAKTLNECKRYQLCGKGVTDVYMHAFGSLEQVYSCDNVHMSKSSLLAEETGNAYFKVYQKEIHIQDNKARSRGGENSNYNYWASLARASHMKYKVFSLGWIRESVFDHYGDVLKAEHQPDGQYRILPANYDKECEQILADAYHREQIHKICKLYKQMAITNGTPPTAELEVLKQEMEWKKHCLAWLEHRRWNAFTRIMGYRYVDAKRILTVKRSQKDMQLKMHACLVEARRPECSSQDTYLHGVFKDNGKVDTDAAFVQFPNVEQDLLDEVSRIRREKDPTKTSIDYKTYDYYRYEFDDYLNVEELAGWIFEDAESVEENCRKGNYKGAVYFENGSQWHVPVKAVQEQIGNFYHELNPDKPEEKDVIDQCKTGQYPQGRELFDAWYVPKDAWQSLEAAATGTNV